MNTKREIVRLSSYTEAPIGNLIKDTVKGLYPINVMSLQGYLMDKLNYVVNEASKNYL